MSAGRGRRSFFEELRRAAHGRARDATIRLRIRRLPRGLLEVRFLLSCVCRFEKQLDMRLAANGRVSAREKYRASSVSSPSGFNVPRMSSAPNTVDTHATLSPLEYVPEQSVPPNTPTIVSAQRGARFPPTFHEPRHLREVRMVRSFHREWSSRCPRRDAPARLDRFDRT